MKAFQRTGLGPMWHTKELFRTANDLGGLRVLLFDDAGAVVWPLVDS
jgi:hypothetical protein